MLYVHTFGRNLCAERPLLPCYSRFTVGQSSPSIPEEGLPEGVLREVLCPEEGLLEGF